MHYNQAMSRLMVFFWLLSGLCLARPAFVNLDYHNALLVGSPAKMSRL